MNNDKKALVFTHYDLDGVVAGEVCRRKLAEARMKPVVYHCGYSDVNETICTALNSESKETVGAVVITDISVSKLVAVFLNEWNKRGVKLALLDHHESATWLNKYQWAWVSSRWSGRNISGTWMANHVNFLSSPLTISLDGWAHSRDRVLGEIVRLTNLYNTWYWKQEKEQDAYDLHLLHHALGTDKFLGFLGDLKLSGATEENPLGSIGRSIVKSMKSNLEILAGEAMSLGHQFTLTQNGKEYKVLRLSGTKFSDHMLHPTQIADIILSKPLGIDAVTFLRDTRVDVRAKVSCHLDAIAIARKELPGSTKYRGNHRAAYAIKEVSAGE